MIHQSSIQLIDYIDKAKNEHKKNLFAIWLDFSKLRKWKEDATDLINKKEQELKRRQDQIREKDREISSLKIELNQMELELLEKDRLIERLKKGL